MDTNQVCKDEKNRMRVGNRFLMQTCLELSYGLGYSDIPFGLTKDELTVLLFS